MNTHLTRRQFLVGAGAGLSAALLAACQPQVMEVTKVVEKQVTQVIKETVMVAGTPKVVEKVVTATPPPPTPKALDKGPLKILWVSQVALVKTFEEYSAKKFGPANNGATVEITVAPDGEFPQKILSGIAAGDPPDIFRAVNGGNFYQFALGGVILPLDELIARDRLQPYLDTFLAGTLEAGRLRGKQYGVTFGAHPAHCYLFYNKTAMTAKGLKIDEKKQAFVKSGYKLETINWKWDEYREYARAMTDSANKVYGAWFSNNFWGLTDGLRSLGIDLLDKTGTKSQVGSTEARRFFTLMHTLITKDKSVPKPSDVASAPAPFAAQKVMMYNHSGYGEAALRNTVKDFEFDTFLIPQESSQHPGLLACDFAAITAASNHVDLAWEWNKGILAVEEGILRVMNAGFIPLPTQEAMLAKESLVSPQYEFYVRQWIANPPMPVPQPANGRLTEVQAELNNGFAPAWLETQPIEAVIDAVDKQVQAILDKAAI
jgi:multiple sugar transport system substrate-binding protein